MRGTPRSGKGCTRLRMTMLLHCCSTQGQLCPTWQSYAGLPPEEGAYVTKFPSRLPLVIRGRSADKRKAFLNFSFPFEGNAAKRQRVYEGKNDNVAPLLPYAGPALVDSRILCRMRAVRIVSARNMVKYQSAGRLPSGSQVSREYHFDLQPRTPPRHFVALSAPVGSMSLDSQVATLPYESSSFAT